MLVILGDFYCSNQADWASVIRLITTYKIMYKVDENAHTKLILFHCEKCSLSFCLKELGTCQKTVHYSKILN